MGNRLIFAVSNNRQMGKRRFELPHRITHDHATPDEPQHFTVIHCIAKSHALVHAHAQMAAQHGQRRAFVTAKRQDLQTVNGGEADIGPLIERFDELNSQATKIVVIPTETDLRHLVRRHHAKITKLIAESAINMRF